MTEMKTPRVGTVDKEELLKSVMETPTAIPAFIGITEKASNGLESLIGKPWKITSMAEFIRHFGGAHRPQFKLSVVDSTDEKISNAFASCFPSKNHKTLMAEKPEVLFSLYYHMLMFFANGGGTCYIVSTGTYEDRVMINASMVTKALDALKTVDDVTLVVVPEAISSKDCYDIQRQVLAHCKEQGNRFAILDVPMKAGGNGKLETQLATFREKIGSDALSYAAAYSPWLQTSIVSPSDLEGEMFIWAEGTNFSDLYAVDARLSELFREKLNEFYEKECGSEGVGTHEANNQKVIEKRQSIQKHLHSVLMSSFPIYTSLIEKITNELSILPPSSAIAALYTTVDNTRGVWKAPINVPLNHVRSTVENIPPDDHEKFSASEDGKAVNDIRMLEGIGCCICSARTLDGNSIDWRYVHVRRTMMYLETLAKKVTKAYESEANEALTWKGVKTTMNDLLHRIWKRGGLAGSEPEEAYDVHVGLGDTMTADDILKDIMRVTVLVAITRPAEFMEITIEQPMQKR